MIQKYVIGTPIETGSVVQEISEGTGLFPGWSRKDGILPAYLATVSDAAKQKNGIAGVLYDDPANLVTLHYHMTPSQQVFGLGETVRGMNKRGWLYASNNADDPNHVEEKHALYASHNFLLVQDLHQCFGIFVDTPGAVWFDIGYTDASMLSITLPYGAANVYYIEEPSCREIVRTLRRLTGKSYIPPKWAFGYGQSRWSYLTADEVREVVKKHREKDIPLDMVCLDIDYMERYKDFTVDETRFPDFAAFVQEMKEEGVRLIPIIDAGVKVEDGYTVYEDGVKNGYFCKKEDGKELVAAVWPGRAHFPDFLREDVRTWFGDQYAVLLKQGIEGFWNDMNEPAIFYTEDHLNEVFEKIGDYQGQNLDVNSFFAFKDLVGSIDNHPEDYRRFYHEPDGQKIRHDQVHNLFGFHMTRAAAEGFKRNSPEKEILLYSRSSCIGAHRYGGIWLGDNHSWWSHLLLNIQQMPGVNMAGFLFCGADTGGFQGDCTEELLLRWMAFSLFTPLFRNHSAMGTRRQEVYAFGNTEAFKNLIRLRYALVPYLYSEFLKAAETDGMFMEPLAFAYPGDLRAVRIEDQLLCGESIMLAPVYTQNATGRYVYLPEDMLFVRFRSDTDYDTEELPMGDHYISLLAEEVAVFVRPGHSLPLAKPGRCVDEMEDTAVTEITYR